MKLNKKILHFSTTLMLGALFVFFQAVWQKVFSSHWLHIDFVTIVIIFFSIEHFLFSTVIKVIILGLLMQSLSAAPFGFFVMYYLFIVLFANIFSKYIVLSKTFSQFMTFSMLILMKYFFVDLIFIKKGLFIDQKRFFLDYAPQFIITLLFTIPLLKVLSRIDNLFTDFNFKKGL